MKVRFMKGGLIRKGRFWRFGEEGIVWFLRVILRVKFLLGR